MRKARLAAIGQVSASMAHDLRNPLGAIRNASYLLRHRLDSDQPGVTEPITIIEEEIERANGIITNLMAIARCREPRKEIVDLGALMGEVHDRLADYRDIVFGIELDPDPFRVLVDRNQFAQVFDNLLTNAIQAMEGAGHLAVCAKREEHMDIIEIHDTGPGIDQAIRDCLFDPLITTKARGTGLGLTICKQIVEAHGGTIEAVDDPEQGSLIRIYLKRGKN